MATREEPGSRAYPPIVKTMLPAITSATTFERNSTRAPNASLHWPCPAVTPTTPSGGTSEIEIATPGRTALRSLRHIANPPAKPVARAATRSIRLGDVRPSTCELVARLSGVATNRAKNRPSTTTIPTPESTQRIERTTRLRWPVTMPSAMPRIGVPSGAMIMAPMTVAVESVSTPAIAIVPANVSMIRKPVRLPILSP